MHYLKEEKRIFYLLRKLAWPKTALLSQHTTDHSAMANGGEKTSSCGSSSFSHLAYSYFLDNSFPSPLLLHLSNVCQWVRNFTWLLTGSQTGYVASLLWVISPWSAFSVQARPWGIPLPWGFMLWWLRVLSSDFFVFVELLDVFLEPWLWLARILNSFHLFIYLKILIRV